MSRFSLFPLALTLLCSNAHAKPAVKTMNAPLSAHQKQLQAQLWQELEQMQHPTPARIARLERLVRAGAPLNAPGKDGELPLMMAVFDSRVMALFLKHGANPNRADADGVAPLHIAAMMGAPGTAKQLIRAGAKLEARNNRGETPLISAAFMMADVSNARDLIAAGAKIEARDKRGMTALSSAAMLEHGAPLVRLLLDAKANINTQENDGTTPLMTAALLGRTDTVQLLVSRDANISARNKRGDTALDTAKTLAILGAVSASGENRKLTPDEEKTRADSKRILSILSRAATPAAAKAVSVPAPKWKSSEWPQRRDAARALARSSDSKALQPLLFLLEDPSWVVRDTALLGLGALWTGNSRVRTGGSALLVKALVKCADSPLAQSTPLLRTDVLQTLGTIGDPAAIAAMPPFLRDKDAAVRLFAINSSKRFHDRETLPDLKLIAQNDNTTSDGESHKDAANKAIAAIEGSAP